MSEIGTPRIHSNAILPIKISSFNPIYSNFFRFNLKLIIKWLILLLLAGCTPPIYQNTTYDIEELMRDSDKIALGKHAHLQLEHDKGEEFFEEIVMDGDELNIALYCPRRPDRMRILGEINQATSFRVCQGKICLPYLSTIEVEGLTLNEVKAKVQTAYCKQIPDTQVFVNFKQLRERHVQIIGAAQPTVMVDGRTRLSEVLARASLPPYANLFKSYVLRNGQQLPIDLFKLIHEGDENQNIVMRGGDQIFIANASDSIIMVMGEVFRPGIVHAPYGFLSLREALVSAGGIPFTGNKGYIQVIRGDIVRPKIYCLAWKDVVHSPNQSLLLVPGDIVVVDERPITGWNRFINQVQPSTAGMQNTYNLYQLIKK